MEKLESIEEGKSELELAKVPATATAHAIPECEMDALLLGRIGVSETVLPVWTKFEKLYSLLLDWSLICYDDV